ncbi:hypothetical protein ACFV83_36410 [Streptomyces pharetrae]|uniref:hypothetical protein n=1 Tax=Streptomyces pharetrae TaxID=291370 RepID=UPI0036462F5E
MARTYPPSAGSLSGSTTTLVFPSDRDGFVVLAESRFAHFEGFALVRRIASGPNAERFAWRGIHAQRPIWAENLALLNWQRGIDLDGRATHPEHPEIPDTFNADYSQVSRIFAEHCFWATYAHGPGAQGCHFEHVVAVDCEAGIFDGSQSGNGYVDCYVFSGGKTEPPYYMKNQSVLMNCHCESPLPPQLHQDTTSIGSSFNVGTLPPNVAKALNVTGGDFLQINGTPAKQAGKPFPAPVASFAGSEKVAVTVDGMQRVVTFADGSFTPHQVAAQINAAFADLGLPRVATANGFINSITIEGWRGHKGSLSVEGSAETLTKIGFPAVPQDAYRPCLLLSSKESANVTFRGYSGPGPDSVGTDHQLSVTMARDGLRPMYWQAFGKDGDHDEFGVQRAFRDGVRRWTFTRAHDTDNATLSFTMPKDPLGPADSLGGDQLLANQGVWLGRGPVRVLLCSGTPKKGQGAFPRSPQDVAWDMSANPPKRYVRKADGWFLEPVGGPTPPPDEALEYTLNQNSLTNVDDAAGGWQFEGGMVLDHGAHVAQYASSRRVTIGGTNALNAATVTLTLFFGSASGQAAENMTLQGAHSFSSGEAIGSVSAASSAFASRVGHHFRWFDGGLAIS